jgi:hypothetical protein
MFISHTGSNTIKHTFNFLHEKSDETRNDEAGSIHAHRANGVE